MSDASRADAALAAFRLIADANALRAAGLFIVEGRENIARLLRTDLVVISVLATPAAAVVLGPAAASRGVLVLDIPPRTMEQITGFNFHRGALALARRPPMRDPHVLLADVASPAMNGAVDGSETADPRRPILVVAEHLVDMDNVGSVFRNARAFGASAVLLDHRCADPLYRKSVRTSMGAVLELPWAQAPAHELLTALDRHGVQTVGLTPQACVPATPRARRRTQTDGRPSVDRRPAAVDVRSLREVCRLLDRSRPVALLVGNEGDGLSAATLARCTVLGHIPMAPGADSLNVATALAIALFEVAEGPGRHSVARHP